MRKKNVLLQVRVPEVIVEELDRLVASGYFKSRSEAVAEGIRRLLLAYSTPSKIPGSIFKLTIEASPQQDLGPGDTFEINVEEARKRILEFFGSDSVDDVVKKMRMRV
jgi:Arc/MetJ-type ribon-helix-helix transcriptional regulator